MENQKIVQTSTTPQSDGVLQMQSPWKKHLFALMGGLHFASKDAKPHFFSCLEFSLYTREPLKHAMIEAEKWNFSALLASAKASPVQGEVGCFSNPEGLLQTCEFD